MLSLPNPANKLKDRVHLAQWTGLLEAKPAVTPQGNLRLASTILIALHNLTFISLTFLRLPRLLIL